MASSPSSAKRKRTELRPDAPPKVLGKTTPRVYTRSFVEGPPGPCGCGCALTDATSLGFSVVEFAADVVKRPLLPWQRWLLIHAMELRPDGALRFRNVVVLVARQNGKSMVSQVLALWSMYVKGRKVVLGTAQDLDTAEEVWQGAVDLVEELDDDDLPVRPELYGEPGEKNFRVSMTNGRKALILATRRRERYKIKAATRGGGRGLSGDLVFLDELREHQTWGPWSALTKTTMARPHAQIWCLSNAGDVRSVVLTHLRKVAHSALGDPDGICAEGMSAPTRFDLEVDPDAEDGDVVELEDLHIDEAALFLAEWSAAPDCKKWDREQWAQANPSMGHDMGPDAGLTEGAVAAAAATDPEVTFRPEVLCQWLSSSGEGFFPPGSWVKSQNVPGRTPDGQEYVKESDRIVGDVVAAIDTARDRSRTYIAFAGRRADGVAQAEIVAVRPGDAWVRDWLMHPDRRGRIECVAGQTRGAQVSPLVEKLRADRTFTIPVVGVEGQDLLSAPLVAYDAVKAGLVRHNRQGPLDTAAEQAVQKALGSAWVVDRFKSPGDVSPLIAWMTAVWLLLRPRKARRPAGVLPVALTSSSSAPARAVPAGLRGSTVDIASVGF